MAALEDKQVYATLLLSDTYLPGALVLAHSLRDGATTKQLVAFVTLDSVSAEVITQLKAVYDHVIPVPRIRNEHPANLHLMDRADLHSAFTKINLWKQTQFSKIVYVDADVLAYRAPDELFNIPAPFSAAPDIGWPDLFNTGVMVLTPNLGDYYALVAMAERGISFDGADQGLLNMYFGNNYNRISFAYNVTPSAHYQYIPAYRHFQSSINMVHFIGSSKPWFKGRDAHSGDSPFDQMFGRWWAVYDRHYRAPQPASSSTGSQAVHQSAPEIVQHFTKGEYWPRSLQPPATGEHDRGASHGTGHERGHGRLPPQPGARNDFGQGSHDEPSSQTAHAFSSSSESFNAMAGRHTEARQDQGLAPDVGGPPPQPPPPPPAEVHRPTPPTSSTWDAQRQPPPPESQPEAINFPSQTYEMSRDPAPFVPPERYPSPPRDMWYEVPKEKPAPTTQKPRAIFPWEAHQPRPSRVFASPSQAQEAFETSTGEHQASSGLQRSTESSFAETFKAGGTSEPAEPATPTIKISPSDPWTAFTRSNAWDEVPEIERYVEHLQGAHRRTRSQGTTGVVSGKRVARDHGFRLTDFPSEVDRPSLPVTPAPTRRPNFWGGGDDPRGGAGEVEGDRGDERLPVAEGVPSQPDWDPQVQLRKLAKQQSEALLRRLGGSDDGVGPGGGKGPERVGRVIPTRPLPFGSEGVSQHAYAAHSPGERREVPLVSPQPVKGSTTTSVVRSMGSSMGSDDGESATTGRTSSMESAATTAIAEPSYHGPGVAWEKGEGVVPVQETPSMPTEEQRDAMDG